MTRAAAVATESDAAFRRTGIGGSDAPPVLGFPLYGRTKFHVYLDKIGQNAPLIESRRMGLGKWLEDPVAKLWAKETGHRVVNARTHVDPLTGMRTRAIRRADRPWMFAHLDRFDDQGDIVEIKVVNAYRTHEFGEEDSDQIPPGLALQVHHQLACVPGAKQAHVAVLLGGDKFLKFVVPRDKGVLNSVDEIEADFWHENVEKRVPPAFDGSDAADDYLTAMFPRDDGEEREATEAENELVAMYALARANRESAEQQEKIHKQAIRDSLGTTAVLLGDRFRITHKLSKDAQTVRWEDLARTLLRIHEEPVADGWISDYTDTKAGSRRFLYVPREGA